MKSKTLPNQLMKKFLLLVFLAPLTTFGQASTTATPAKDPVLLGVCTRDSLAKEPYKQWFEKGYNDYTPNEKVIAQLKKIDFDDCAIQIFFGSWCGDSKREVPRLFKILDQISFPKRAVTIIAVSADDSVYKQSPTREERGMDIYRVGTFILSRRGVEVNRVVEFPVHSLESDLLSIFSGASYRYNYASYSYISKWIKDGTLLDSNISYRGLANEIRSVVTSPGELNSSGYVLLSQGNVRAAVTIFRMNCFLYPENANAYSSLAEGLAKMGDTEKAIAMIVKALELNKEPAQIKPALELYYKIKSGARSSKKLLPYHPAK